MNTHFTQDTNDELEARIRMSTRLLRTLMMALRGKMSEAGPLPIPIYNVCQLAFTAHSWGRPCWVCSTEIVIIAGSGSTVRGCNEL